MSLVTNQAHHEIGQVGGGDLSAYGQLAAEDQTDLELVVQQLHMRGLDDVAELGLVTDPEALRKKVSGVLAGSRPTSLTCEAKSVARATTRHGVVIGDSSARLCTGTVSVLLRGGVDGRTVGQQLTCGGRVGIDASRTRGGLHPPRVGGAQN